LKISVEEHFQKRTCIYLYLFLEKKKNRLKCILQEVLSAIGKIVSLLRINAINQYTINSYDKRTSIDRHFSIIAPKLLEEN